MAKAPTFPVEVDWPAPVRGLRSRVVRWYRAHGRDLPWRRTADPYAIWVSEVMLQQTQVATVLRYFQPFLERFPTIRDLAAASPPEVLSAWSGLGYYRRARMMHQAAKVVCEHHGGVFPNTLEDVRALPGVGAYTSGAVMSIAFGVPVPAVDGNVNRVLARLLGMTGDPTRGPHAATVTAAAGALTAGTDPGDVVQGLMELGATVCTPVAPQCDRCPWRNACKAREGGDPESIPPPRQRAARKPLHVALALVCQPQGILMLPRAPTGLFGGLHELPSSGQVEGTRGKAPGLNRMHQALAAAHVNLEIGNLLARTERTLSHRDMVLWTFQARLRPGVPMLEQTVTVPRDDLGQAPLSTAMRMALRDALTTLEKKP